MRPQLVILSGPRESGKTTRLGGLAARARRSGWDVAGLLTHPVLRDGERMRLELEDLRSRERRELAERNPSGETVGYSTRMWRFDREVLAWGNQALAQATPCGLLIVDELGKLELERHLGFTVAFAVLDSLAYRLAVAVVRPELVPLARARWPKARIVYQRR
jgi:nucleoside-triphosphatase THEP1